MTWQRHATLLVLLHAGAALVVGAVLVGFGLVGRVLELGATPLLDAASLARLALAMLGNAAPELLSLAAALAVGLVVERMVHEGTWDGLAAAGATTTQRAAPFWVGCAVLSLGAGVAALWWTPAARGDARLALHALAGAARLAGGDGAPTRVLGGRTTWRDGRIGMVSQEPSGLTFSLDAATVQGRLTGDQAAWVLDDVALTVLGADGSALRMKTAWLQVPTALVVKRPSSRPPSELSVPELRDRIRQGVRSRSARLALARRALDALLPLALGATTLAVAGHAAARRRRTPRGRATRGIALLQAWLQAPLLLAPGLWGLAYLARRMGEDAFVSGLLGPEAAMATPLAVLAALALTARVWRHR